MLKRYILLPVALAAAGGVPFVAVNKDLSNRFKGAVDKFTQGDVQGKATSVSSATDSTADLALNPASLNEPLAPTAPPNSLPGSDSWSGASTVPTTRPSPHAPPIHLSLFDVFRFDITPEWVKARWPHVSTGWTSSRLEGMRVPLVTGTTPQDLHGSLTYFFNKRHQVERIQFVGDTGDARQLADLVTRYHGFRKVPSAHAGLFVRSFNGRPVGVLRVTYSPSVRASRPHQQLSVVLEINSTTGDFVLSDDVARLLESEKLSDRW